MIKLLRSVLFSSLLIFNGCAVMSHVPVLKYIYSGPTTRNTKAVDKAQNKTDKEQAQLEALQKQLTDRVAALEQNKVLQGSAFVYGTGQALDHATSSEPAVSLAKELNSVAGQALPKPSTSDTIKMDGVVSDSLSTDTNRVAAAGQELGALKSRLSKTEGQEASVTAKLDAKIADAKEDRDAALQKERARADSAAVKANQYDEANSLFGSAKLFLKNAWKLLVSVLVLGLVFLGIWRGGKLAAAVYCPPVALGMNSFEGLATKELSAGFSQLVKGGETFKDYVEKSNLTAEAKAAVADLFRRAHLESQDQKVQAAVGALTK